MRIFVTGATGFIGSAIVNDLIGAGHQVLGLARSDAGANALAAAGATAHRGDLNDIGSLRSGAEAADGIIHAGFIHDWANFAASCETDRVAIETMAAVLAGSDRPLIVTSGTALLSPGSLATEDIVAVRKPNSFPRIATELAAMAAAERGVRAAMMRLPPSVHGDGDHGFVPMLIGLARQKGVAAYIGEGGNVWPAVHRLDAARAFRLAVEKATPGARHHATAERGVPFREIAGIIGKRLGLPVASVSAQEAAAHFGWFAHFAALDCPASSAWTRETLGWAPTQPGLLADLDRDAYFGG